MSDLFYAGEVQKFPLPNFSKPEIAVTNFFHLDLKIIALCYSITMVLIQQLIILYNL